MAATVTADIVNRLEIDYRPRKLMSLALKNSFLTAWFPKSEDGGGEKVNLRYWTSTAGGSGSTVAEAEAAERANGYVVSSHDWKLMYTAQSLNVATLNRTKNTSIGDELTLVMRGAMERHGNLIETALIDAAGNASMRLGRRASISGDTITLSDPNDVFNFEPGMVITADDTADGSSLRVGTSPVASVDHNAGKVTLVDETDITSFADNDYLFLKGTGFQASAGPKGLFSIIPPTVSGSDSFGGLNRSSAPDLLAGWRKTGTAGRSKLEQILDMVTHGSKTYSQAPDLALCSVDTLAEVKKTLLDKVEYKEFASQKYGVRFKGVVIDGPDGQFMLKSHRQYSNSYIHFLTRNTWRLRSVNEALIAVATKTGKYIDAQSDDAIKLRWRSQFGLFCDIPKDNGVGTFA